GGGVAGAGGSVTSRTGGSATGAGGCGASTTVTSIGGAIEAASVGSAAGTRAIIASARACTPTEAATNCHLKIPTWTHSTSAELHPRFQECCTPVIRQIHAVRPARRR